MTSVVCTGLSAIGMGEVLFVFDTCLRHLEANGSFGSRHQLG